MSTWGEGPHWEFAGLFLGEVFVDDEDEFQEHMVTLGCPDRLIEVARASCETVLAARLAALRPG